MTQPGSAFTGSQTDGPVPQFAFPLTLTGSGFAVVEQDSLDEVAQCVQVLCATPLGSRTPLPAYGIEDPTGTRSLDTPDVLAAIIEWEPRAVTDIGDPQIIDGLGTLQIGVSQQ